jgi:hypothetical protein
VAEVDRETDLSVFYFQLKESEECVYNWPYLRLSGKGSSLARKWAMSSCAVGGTVALKFSKLYCYKGVLLWLRRKNQ